MKENHKRPRSWFLVGNHGNGSLRNWRLALVLLMVVGTILIFHGSGGRDSSSSKVSRKALLAWPATVEPVDSFSSESDTVMISLNEVDESKPHWNTSSFRFEPTVSNWDKRRAKWMRKNNLRLRLGDNSKTRVMIVSGSQPRPCEREISNLLLLRSAKSKLDYTRIHDMQFFYNMANPHPDFDGWWVKLPLLHMLMLQHPETEWFWWIDSDAVITDMSFEPPFDSEEYKQYNLVMWGDEQMVFENKTWVGVNAGVYAIRNCQWSLDLMDAWGSLGPKPIRKVASEYLNMGVVGRPPNFDSDDQSGIVYLLVTEKAKWADKVKLERGFAMSGDWEVFTPKFEELVANYHPGLGDHRWPLITHFAGCQPCGAFEWGKHVWDDCVLGMTRSFVFGDNQTLPMYGFKAVSLNDFDIVPMLQPEGDEKSKQGGYSLPGPKMRDWNKHRQAWLKKYPTIRRPEVLLATASRPNQCETSDVAYLLMRAMKNKVDYCRLHDIELFYGMAVLDKELMGNGWSKLPILRTMMLSYPEVEWIWWVDSDAVITDMDFEIPFKHYKKYNLVMYGNDDLVFQQKRSSGISTGNFLIRNCQWSLDLLDAWAAMGPLSGSVREATGVVLSKTLSDFAMGMPADEQSALVYLLLTAKPSLTPEVFFEKSFAMNGDWTVVTERFEKMAVHERPFVTHFEDCGLCQESESVEAKHPLRDCMKEMDRAFHFAENQILGEYGLQHEDLSTSSLVKLELASERLLAKVSRVK